jgi:Carboxypeptidase regulatory-like domain
MGVLSDADGRLRAWLAEAAGDTTVVPGTPADDDTRRDTGADRGAGDPALTAYLLAIEPAPKLANDPHRPTPVVLRLRYVVAAQGPSDAAALELIDRLLAASVDSPLPADLEVDFAPVPIDVWQALGVRPRPAVTVRVTARYAPAVPDVPVVREPLKVVGAGVRRLRGTVLGNDDVPLAGAEVVVAATQATTRTSASGTFEFASVPDTPDPVRLAVRTKGRTFTADVRPDDGQPVVVHCDLLEA